MTTLSLLRQLANNLLPGHCPLCLDALPPALPVCGGCMSDLPWSTALSACDAQAPVLSAFDYTDPVKQLLLAGKTGKQLDKLHLLARLTAHALPARITALPEAILPVPLHPARLRQRGFNQSLELAKPLAKALGLPLLVGSINRQRNTHEQKSLRVHERRQNMQDAFQLRHANLPYQHIAIFDDVLTTGATCAELEALLLANGVAKVQIWACARTKQ